MLELFLYLLPCDPRCALTPIIQLITHLLNCQSATVSDSSPDKLFIAYSLVHELPPLTLFRASGRLLMTLTIRSFSDVAAECRAPIASISVRVPSRLQISTLRDQYQPSTRCSQTLSLLYFNSKGECFLTKWLQASVDFPSVYSFDLVFPSNSIVLLSIVSIDSKL